MPARGSSRDDLPGTVLHELHRPEPRSGLPTAARIDGAVGARVVVVPELAGTEEDYLLEALPGLHVRGGLDQEPWQDLLGRILSTKYPGFPFKGYGFPFKG